MSDKLLLITGDFFPVKGGISTFLFELYHKIPQLTVLTKRVPHAEAFDSLQNFTIRRIRSFTRWLHPFLFALKAYGIARKEKKDILVCGQLLVPGMAGYIIHKLLGKPYFVYFYGPEFEEHRKWTPLLKCILKNASQVMTISHFSKAQLLKNDIPLSKITIVTPGVDTARFKPNLNAERILNRHNLGGKRILLTLSRLDVNKGIDKMIRLMPALSKKYKDILYLIVGKGPEEKHLKKLAAEHSSGNILFAGEVLEEELPLYYACCDVFILLTHEVPRKGYVEGFGIVFIEASACGKPVIAGRAGGSPDAVADKISGFLVDSHNQEEVLFCVERLLEDDNLRMRLGADGRKRVEEEFTWDRKHKQLLEAIS